MIPKQVFLINSSAEDSKPDIYNYDKKASDINWSKINSIMSGYDELSEYAGSSIVLRKRDATKWDFYFCPGAIELLSKRAADLLRPYLGICFELAETSLNGEPYFCCTANAKVH